jgi:NAD/NADP transhydrogenase beta subunit
VATATSSKSAAVICRSYYIYIARSTPRAPSMSWLPCQPPAVKPGSITVVDLAAEAGGNIETTVPGSILVFSNGVTCIGYTDLPSRLATQASTLYSNNKINVGLGARNLVVGGVFLATGNPAIGTSCLYASTAMFGVLGMHMTARIGAADLAVVITLLNAYSGLALAAEGVLLDNDLLTIVGALIASSGSVLFLHHVHRIEQKPIKFYSWRCV